MMFRNRKAQSTAEYAVVLSLVIAAAIGMQVYVKRGVQARIKTTADGYVEPAYTFSLSGQPESATFSSVKQYEPYYTRSQYDTFSDDQNVENVHTGTVGYSSESIQARNAGGYQIQEGVSAADTAMRDKERDWENR